MFTNLIKKLKRIKSFLLIIIFLIPAFFSLASDADVSTSVVASVPSGLGLSVVSSTKIDLSWSAVSGAVSYKIYRDGSFLASSSNTSYSDTGLTSNTTYSYTVSAVNSYEGESAESSSVSDATLGGGGSVLPTSNFMRQPPVKDTIAPSNISALKVEAGDKKIELSWLNPKDSDFNLVKINRSIIGYPLKAEDGVEVYAGNATSFIDIALINKVKYFYTIFSCDIIGNCSSGAIVFAVPKTPTLVPEKITEEIVSIFPPEVPEEIIPLIPSSGESREPAAQPLIYPKEEVKLSDFEFKIQSDIGPIKMSPEQLGRIRLTKGTPLFISIPVEYFAKEVEIITITVRSDSNSFLFQLNEETNSFEVTIDAPLEKGKHSLIINVIYQDGTIDTIFADMLVDPYGYIYEKRNINGEIMEVRIPNAKVTLFWFNPIDESWEK